MLFGVEKFWFKFTITIILDGSLSKDLSFIYRYRYFVLWFYFHGTLKQLTLANDYLKRMTMER